MVAKSKSRQRPSAAYRATIRRAKRSNLARWIAAAAGVGFATATAMIFVPPVYAQLGGISPGDSQQPPRRAQPLVPQLPDEVEGANLHGSRLETSFAGLVTGVAADRISVKMAPPRVAAAMEQVFKVTKETAVLVNGDAAPLTNIKEGDIVRVTTSEARPEYATRITAVDPPGMGRSAAANTVSDPTPPSREVPSVPAVALNPNAGGGSANMPSVGNPRAGVATSPEDSNPNFAVYPNLGGAAPKPANPPADRDTRMPADNNGNAADGANTAGNGGGGENAAVSGPAATIDQALAVMVQDSPGDGVIVVDARPDGPAASAGVQPGDYLMKMNGKAVADPAALAAMLSAAPNATDAGAGEQAQLSLWRDGQTRTVTVVPGMLRPADQNAAQPAAGNQRAMNNGAAIPVAPNEPPANPLSQGNTIQIALLGVELRDAGRAGVEVTTVNQANTSGLQPGDLILSVGGHPVDNRRDLMDELHRLPDDATTAHMVIRRGDKYAEIAAPIEKPQG